jgi:hypothetical protein
VWTEAGLADVSAADAARASFAPSGSTSAGFAPADFTRVGTGAARAGATLPRTPFALLVLALLGGGLICLLVINTTLGASSFRITQLQRTNANLLLQQRMLQGEIAGEKAPPEIAKLAYQLGMRPQTSTTILDLSKHRTYRLPGQAGAWSGTTAGSGQ